MKGTSRETPLGRWHCPRGITAGRAICPAKVTEAVVPQVTVPPCRNSTGDRPTLCFFPNISLRTGFLAALGAAPPPLTRLGAPCLTFAEGKSFLGAGGALAVASPQVTADVGESDPAA